MIGNPSLSWRLRIARLICRAWSVLSCPLKTRTTELPR